VLYDYKGVVFKIVRPYMTLYQGAGVSKNRHFCVIYGRSRAKNQNRKNKQENLKTKADMKSYDQKKRSG